MGRRNAPATWRDAEKVAEHLGFLPMKGNQTSGSHGQHKHPVSGNKVTIPKYKEPYGPDLLSSICRQMGTDKKGFYQILGRIK